MGTGVNILWHMPTLRLKGCGLSNRALRFAHELRGFGHSVSFCVATKKTDIAESRINEMPLHRLTALEPRLPHWSVQALGRRMQAAAIVKRFVGRPDLFVSCQPEVVSAYRRRNKSRPVIFVCGGTTLLHDPADLRRRGRLSWPLRSAFALDRSLKHGNESAAFKAANAVVFCSDDTMRRVIDAYGIQLAKCHTMYGGIDPKRFRPPSPDQRETARARFALKPGDIVLAWTGRLAPEKNLPLLIRALARCRKRPKQVLLVGEGSSRDELRSLGSRAGVENLLTFVGEVEDVRPYLHAADIFVFPSQGESFGISLVEAMACGLPCVALDSSDAEVRNACDEIFGRRKCGVLIKGNNASEFASALDELSCDPRRRRSLGDLAVRRAHRHFTWAESGRRFESLIRRLVPQNAPAEVRQGLSERPANMAADAL